MTRWMQALALGTILLHDVAAGQQLQAPTHGQVREAERPAASKDDARQAPAMPRQAPAMPSNAEPNALRGENQRLKRTIELLQRKTQLLEQRVRELEGAR